MPRIRPENSTREETLGQTLGQGAYGAARLGGSGATVWKGGEIEFPKVRYLITHRVVPTRPWYSYAWPEAIGLDQAGQPVAYAMAQAKNGVDTMKLFSPVNVPAAFRVRVALNHIRSLIDLEACGYRRGDVPNSVFHDDGSITEFDLDSLQVTRPDAQFNGGFFKALTVPPELIDHFESGGGPGFEVTREHDAWVAAVLVWLLLMEGEHPFDFCWQGVGQRPHRSEIVKAGLWPYSGRFSDVTPRPATKRFDTLDAELQVLFEKAFLFGHPNADPQCRPALSAWESALARLDCGGDVTLDPAQWIAISSGHPVPAARKPVAPPPRRVRRARSIAGSLVVAGGGAAAALMVSAAGGPLLAPAKPLSAVEAAIASDLVSQQSLPGRAHSRPAANGFTRDTPWAPPIPLVDLADLPGAAPGANPSLWQELERR